MSLQSFKEHSGNSSALAKRVKERGNFMMEACEDLFSLCLVFTVSPGKGTDYSPDLWHKGLALQQAAEYNLQP